MGISLSLELMLLVFFIFILSIILLNKWLYKPILEFMDSREAMIKNDLGSAATNEEEITKINDEILGILDEAKKSAAKLREDAHAEAKAAYDAKLQKAREANEKDLADFMRSIATEKDALKTALAGQIPDFQKSLNAKLKNLQK